jgi:membrane protein DedA with SNARE-associated domain
MLDSLLEWLRYHEGPTAYLVLGWFAGVEYICPPLPGDTVTLFAIFLALRANYHPAWVFASISLGSLLGASAAYGVGRWASRSRLLSLHAEVSDSHSPAVRVLRQWLRSESVRQLEQRIHVHATWLLLINRFVPAFRAVIFFAAGMGNVPFSKVLFWGGASAVLWNGLLFGAGYFFQANWARLQELLSTYAVVLGIVIAFALGAWWFDRQRRSR